MAFKVVNPFSSVCAQAINLDGQHCALSPPVVEEPLFGPLAVKTICTYSCRDPIRVHAIVHYRIFGFLEWFYDKK